MAFPIALLALGLLGGGYYLLQPTKKQGQAPAPGGAPVVVPPGALPVPPGGVPAEEMPGGPPTVVVTPPGTSSTTGQTPQQVLTQTIPNIVSQVTKALPQATTPAVTKTVPAPGETQPAAHPTGDLTDLTNQLPNLVTQVITAASGGATPLQTTETHPDLDPNGTIALAKLLIDREQTSGWKSALAPEIKTWQARVGLTQDGKFGPGSALRMAQEVGVLPLVRYWPASSQKNVAVPAYQSALRTLAAKVQPTNPAHAAALGLSAAFEQGQTYGTTNPPPVPLQSRTWQSDTLQAQLSK